MRAGKKVKITGIQADWKHPTHIRFGVERLKELPDVCWNLGACSPLLVTDHGVAKLPVVQTIRSLNREQSIETGLFSALTGEPDQDCVRQGAEYFRKNGHDSIIAIGGGSALDAGKAIALAGAVGPKGLWSYRTDNPHPPGMARPIPPIIAIPTTTGTGSEVDANAVITQAETNRKISLFHKDLLPGVVIADPTLTRRLNPFLTAATGMDALSHNLEALCSPVFQPILDGIAIHALGLIKDWLPRAFHQGRNLEARTYTMAASIMGAMAFEKGLGAAHAVAHALGSAAKIHHGRAVGALLPFVLKMNQRAVTPKMAHLARNLGLPGQDFQAVLNWILDLRHELGLPASLGELGIKQAHIPTIVESALTDVNLSTNPIPVTANQLQRLLQKAVQGKL